MKSLLGKRKFPFDKYASYNIETMLQEVKGKFSPQALHKLPPVIFVHQLYNQGPSRTWVDQQIGLLKDEGKIKLFKLHVEKDDSSTAAIFTEDLIAHIARTSDVRGISQYVEDILPHIKDACVEKSLLKNQFNLSESNLRLLVHEGLFVIRDVGKFWLSFPGAGDFVKTYNLGRKHLIRTLGKAKYLEILETELLKRNLPKKAILGMDYHIRDLIGSDEVKCDETTSGKLLRIRKH